MEESILSKPKLLYYIVEMLRSDSFDDAVGQVEGWRVFADLMKTLMEDDNLKAQIEGRGSEITKVLEEKLKRGKSKGIRTSLVSLEILRSLGEQTNDSDQVDVWTHGLVDKGVAYLQSEKWKTQKAGIAILSALAQTQHGVDAIKPHIKDMVNRLLPNSRRLDSNSTDTGGSPLKPSCMLGPACALRVLSEDATLRKATNAAQLEALQDLWLDGKLIVEDTPSWRVGTPARDDVLEMIDKMIKSVSGDFSEDLGVTSVGRSALPEIHHWGRLAALVRKSVGKVVAPPVNAAVRAVRYTSQRLSHRQITYLLDCLEQVRWQHGARD
ncbi:hypothetical protein PAXINDRAFT_172470 [Paxillus involutus ATCC 200175]|uniref:Uncharacterized protein n=1 Tax=Paxillus involutus ATCC 200175 TaxID=664439 RepID=A0A0C9TF23_PAXIN|nr:hypothetical protein PAXINDRAFT_172470 [Paxillus involutus ATCC 200175]